MLLIVGATGLLGSKLYRKCKEKGISVLGTSTTGQQEGMIRFRLGEDDPGSLLTIFESDDSERAAVITGAVTNLNECYKNPDLSYKVNVLGTRGLTERLKSEGIKTVWISSDCVFDGVSGGYTESSDTNPLCVYGKQKEEMEVYFRENCPEGLVFRISKQYDTEFYGNHLLSDLYKSAMSGKIRCIDGLKFNPTYVGDTAECILKGIDKDLRGLYNLASPHGISRYELAHTFAKTLGMDKVLITKEPMEEFGFAEPRALDM